jgi:small subunit ribosomal protein S8
LSVSDPIADYLTCIRNAIQAKKKRLDVPSSNMKRALTEILRRERFIRDFKVIEDSKQNVLRIFLNWGPNDQPAIQGIQRVSRPGRRVYVRKQELPRVRGGMGMAVLSTSSGVLTDKEARKRGLGGEVLCKIW